MKQLILIDVCGSREYFSLHSLDMQASMYCMAADCACNRHLGSHSSQWPHWLVLSPSPPDMESTPGLKKDRTGSDGGSRKKSLEHLVREQAAPDRKANTRSLPFQ